MKTVIALLLASTLACAPAASSQEMHAHPAPEKLGRVSFPTSCAPAVAHDFERAVALLHSFAYTASEQAFRGVADADPSCAMAHWGIAMSHSTSCGARPPRTSWPRAKRKPSERPAWVRRPRANAR